MKPSTEPQPPATFPTHPGASPLQVCISSYVIAAVHVRTTCVLVRPGIQQSIQIYRLYTRYTSSPRIGTHVFCCIPGIQRLFQVFRYTAPLSRKPGVKRARGWPSARSARGRFRLKSRSRYSASTSTRVKRCRRRVQDPTALYSHASSSCAGQRCASTSCRTDRRCTKNSSPRQRLAVKIRQRWQGARPQLHRAPHQVGRQTEHRRRPLVAGRRAARASSAASTPTASPRHGLFMEKAVIGLVACDKERHTAENIN